MMLNPQEYLFKGTKGYKVEDVDVVTGTSLTRFDSDATKLCRPTMAEKDEAMHWSTVVWALEKLKQDKVKATMRKGYMLLQVEQNDLIYKVDTDEVIVKKAIPDLEEMISTAILLSGIAYQTRDLVSNVKRGVFLTALTDHVAQGTKSLEEVVYAFNIECIKYTRVISCEESEETFRMMSERLHGLEDEQEIPNLLNGKSIPSAIGINEENTKVTEQYEPLYRYFENDFQEVPEDITGETVMTENCNDIMGVVGHYLSRYKDGKKVRPLNILLEGAPGTGKSYDCDVVAGYYGLPVYHCACGPNMEESDFVRIPVLGEKTEMVDSIPYKAFRDGGLLVLEEFNLVRPDVLQGALSQALERPYVMGTTPTEMIHRNPLCIIVGTANAGLAGTKEANQAFLNRFSFVLKYKPSTREDLVARTTRAIEQYVDGESIDVESCVDGYLFMQEQMKQNEELTQFLSCISPRNIAYAGESLATGMNLKKALERTMIAPVRMSVEQFQDDELLKLFEEAVAIPMVKAVSKSGKFRKQVLPE